MKVFETTTSNAEAGANRFWVRAWARAREKYFGRVTDAQLGDPADARRANRAEDRLELTKARFIRGFRRIH